MCYISILHLINIAAIYSCNVLSCWWLKLMRNLQSADDSCEIECTEWQIRQKKKSFNISHLWLMVPTVSSVSDAAKSPWRITVQWGRLTQSSRPVSLWCGVSAQVMTAFLVTATSLLCVIHCCWKFRNKQVVVFAVSSLIFKNVCVFIAFFCC